MVRRSRKQRSRIRSVRRSQKTQSKGGRKSLRKGGADGLETTPKQAQANWGTLMRYRKAQAEAAKRLAEQKKEDVKQVGGGILFLFVDDAHNGLLLADENQKQIYEIAKEEFAPKVSYASYGHAWWFDDKKYYISKNEMNFKYGERVMRYTWGIKSGKYFMLNKDSKKIRFFTIYKFDKVDYEQIKRENLITYEKEQTNRHDF